MAYHFNNRIEVIEVKEDDFMPGVTEKKVIAKPWADVKTMKGKEFNESGGTINEAPIRFIIRYRKGIHAAQLVKYNGIEYNIKSVANDNGQNHTLTLFATSIE